MIWVGEGRGTFTSVSPAYGINIVPSVTRWRQMTPEEEYLALLRDEIACVTMDSKIDDTRVSWTPVMNLLKLAPPGLLRQPNFGRLVTLLHIQTMMTRKQMRLPEPLAFRLTR